MYDRRSILKAGGVFASCFGTSACRGTVAHCRFTPTLSLLDSSAMESWELCGKQRKTRVLSGDKYWNERLPGLPLPVRSLLGTDVTATNLLVLDLQDFPRSRIAVCDVAGRQSLSVDIPPKGRLASVRADSAGGMVALFEGSDPAQENGIYSKTPEKPWRFIANAPKNAIVRVTFHGSDIVWSEDGALHRADVQTGTKRSLGIAGDAPCLSPDGSLLYFREQDKTPTVRRWPSMERVMDKQRGMVGTLALWAPNGEALILERTRAFLEAVILDVKTGQMDSLGTLRSRGTMSSYLSLVEWGSDGPEMLRKFEVRG